MSLIQELLQLNEGVATMTSSNKIVDMMFQYYLASDTRDKKDEEVRKENLEQAKSSADLIRGKAKSELKEFLNTPANMKLALLYMGSIFEHEGDCGVLKRVAKPATILAKNPSITETLAKTLQSLATCAMGPM